MDRLKYAEVVDAVTTALAGLDQDTYCHSQRVQRLAVRIGIIMGLNSEELTRLSLGSLLHDVGKQHIPPEILQKEGKLDQEEWKIVRHHPIHGWEYANASKLDQAVKEIILHHHLWYDGQGGYPGKLNGVSPSLLAQITTVADVVDAMTQDRPYRKALSIKTSLDYLQEKSGSQFGPDVVESVLHNLNQIRSIIA